MDNFDFETSDIVAEATKKYSPEKGKKKQDQFDMKKKIINMVYFQYLDLKG